MPELMLTPTGPAGFAVPPTIIPKNKDDMEKYASIIREVNNFANSDVGKQILTPLIQKFAQPSAGPNGLVHANQGDNKPMPQESNPKSPFFNGDKPGRRVGPASESGPVQERVVIQQVPTPMPVELDSTQQFDLFLGGLMKIQQHLGEDKTLKEAIEWTTSNKTLIVSMTPPLRINPKTA